jgi:hypothetical protein
MIDPLRKKLKKRAKKAQRRTLEDVLEQNGHHSPEKHPGRKRR